VHVRNPSQVYVFQSVTSKNIVLCHLYYTHSTYAVHVTVVDKDGAVGIDDVIVTVANTRFQVLSFTPTVSGFDVRFNRSVDTSKLNLYDGLDASIDPSDVAFLGTSTGQVHGSIVWDFQANVLRFVKTGGPLAPDNYTVNLQSRSDGFTDASRQLLDRHQGGL